MLETMRNQAQSWIAKLILGGIALSFALWGIGDYFMGGSLVTVAEVDGKPVSEAEFYQAYERQLNTYRAMLGKQFSKSTIDAMGIKQDTIQTIINRRLMLDEATHLGLTAPETTVLARVRSNPAFQSAGSFDAQRYRILTRNMGFRTPADYETDLRLNLMVDALQQSIISSANVNEQEIRDRFAVEYEQREIAAIIIDPDSLRAKANVSDEQARAYYEAHKENYRSPLRLKLTAVDISPAALAVDIAVDDEEVRAAYESRKEEFFKPEERQARHILIRVNDSATDAMRTEARNKIESAQARIKAGEGFAAVARDVSEDVTADKGGDLGFFVRGVMVPAFDEVAFSMQKGDISDIIETQFGYHLIQLVDIRAASETPFEEVRETLAAEIKSARAAEEAYRLSQDLDDALGMEDSLKAAAESLNLTVHEIGPISQDEALANKLLSSDPALRAQTFAIQPGQAIEITELDNGHFAAIEVLERIEPDVLPYAKVAAAVHEDARHAEAIRLARDLAGKILAETAGKTLDALVQAYGQPKYISKPVRKSGIGDDASWLTSSVLDAAFRTAKGQWVSNILEVPQGLAIVRVQSVIAPSEEEYIRQRNELAGEVEKAKGAVRFARWMASVRNRHEITIDQTVLERF